MGYLTEVHGSIEIDPPARWSVVRPYANWTRPDDVRCAYLGCDDIPVETDEGQLIRRVGARIEPHPGSPFKAYTLVEDVQSIIDALGRERRYVGEFQCEGEDFGDIWRLVVVDGVAKKLTPRILWPDETETLPR